MIGGKALLLFRWWGEGSHGTFRCYLQTKGHMVVVLYVVNVALKCPGFEVSRYLRDKNKFRLANEIYNNIIIKELNN